jgi:hypothetical protein
MPERRQVLRWRDRHRLVVCFVGGGALGYAVQSPWAALLVGTAWGVLVWLAHSRLDRRYDRIQEEVRNATG